MTTCPRCKQPIIRTLWCGEPVDLAPGPRVFATLEPFADDPADGVRVFCATNSYVEHRAVCPAAKLPSPTAPVPRRTTTTKGAKA
jgi:hypothetical protein